MILIKLVDARKGLHEKCKELFHHEKVAESIYMYLCDGLEECDVIEPERKTGKWIYHPDWEADGECGYECSECGMGSEVDYDYCMRCGADMRGEQE